MIVTLRTIARTSAQTLGINKAHEQGPITTEVIALMADSKIKLVVNRDGTFVISGKLSELAESKSGKVLMAMGSGGAVKTGVKYPGTQKEIVVSMNGWVGK